MPTVKVRKGTIDDVKDCARIVVEAYSTLDSNSLLFPNESKSREKLIQSRINQFSTHLQQQHSQDVTQYRVAYIEGENGDGGGESTAALLRWSLQTVEDIKEHDSDTIIDAVVADKLALLGPDYVNVDLFRTFRLSRERKHKQYFEGKGPHIFIHTLAVSPNYQRMGCGSKLMENTIKEADQLGLTCYLEASHEGKPLYLRYGFQEVEKLLIQSSNKEQKFVLTLMIRPAKKE